MMFCFGATVGRRIGDPYLMRHLAAKSADLMLVNLPHCNCFAFLSILELLGVICYCHNVSQCDTFMNVSLVTHVPCVTHVTNIVVICH
jgi:hypothetical protein